MAHSLLLGVETSAEMGYGETGVCEVILEGMVEGENAFCLPDYRPWNGPLSQVAPHREAALLVSVSP